MGAVITFKPGDEVELKSGGPRMTVLQSYVHNGRGNNHDYAECQWYEKGEYKKNVFLKSSLHRRFMMPSPVSGLSWSQYFVGPAERRVQEWRAAFSVRHLRFDEE